MIVNEAIIVRWRRGLAAMLVAIHALGCSATHEVDLGATAALAEEVLPGDRVHIITTDGRELDFEVTGVEPDAIIGAELRVERAEIAELEVKRLSAARTGALVGGVGLTAFAIIALVLASIPAAMP
jgi:hypothetical protein